MTAVLRYAAIAVVLGLVGPAAARALTYTRGDVLYVIYQPQGRELIVNLGPKEGFLDATAPLIISQFSAADVTNVFGSPLPANLRVAVIASADVDAYLASNGPSTISKIGSAIGAASQIESFGGNWLFSSLPDLGNPNEGTFLFGDLINYQKSLDGSSTGSLGGNVPFNVEVSLSKAPLLVNLFLGKSNPFTGDPPVAKLLGRLSLQTDGTLEYFPARVITAVCVANPQTVNVQSNGHGFSFDVTLTDVTDPANPASVDLSRMSLAHISQAASTLLPVPSLAPNCSASQDGLWEDVSKRTPTSITYDISSDGVCSTADGDRQDLISAMGNVLDGSTVPVCFKSDVETNAVSCCSQVRVLNKGNR
jgi:hypothetical protein